MAYQDLVPVGSTLIIAATSFGLGVVYANLPYDLNTLWVHDNTGAAFNASLAHYALWASTPNFVHHILHAVAALGLIGCFIKLYKPHEDAKYFEYGTLGLFMVAIIIYLTNLRVGAASAVSGKWGDVDMHTGINVIAASEVMIVIALMGVILLQGGLYYAQWYDNKVQAQFYKEQAEEAASAAAAAAEDASKETTESAKASGAAANKTKAKKRTA